MEELAKGRGGLQEEDEDEEKVKRSTIINVSPLPRSKSGTTLSHSTNSASTYTPSSGAGNNNMSEATSVGWSFSRAWKRANWPLLTVGFSLFQAFIISILEVVILVLVNNFLRATFDTGVGTASFITIYFSLFILAQFFQAFLFLDAYLSKNTLQVFAIQIFNAMSIIYAAVQIQQVEKLKACATRWLQFLDLSNYTNILTDSPTFQTTISDSGCPVHPLTLSQFPTVLELIQSNLPLLDRVFPIEVSIIVLLVIFNSIGGYLSYKCYKVYGWTLFKINGASIEKKNMLRNYHAFLLLLKFNLYFSAGIVAQICAVIYFQSKNNVSSKISDAAVYPALAVVIFVSVVYFLCGYFGVRSGSVILMSTFLFLIVCNIVAVSFTIYIVQTDHAYAITVIWLTAFAIIQLVLNVVSVISGLMCMSDFKHGIIEIIRHSENPNKRKTQQRFEIE